MTRANSGKRRSELVAALEAAAPRGLGTLNVVTLDRLARITQRLLVTASPEVLASAERFEHQRDRVLVPDSAALREGVEGRVVLVTGGTGCIGSALLRELRLLGATRLVSVSRGMTAFGPAVEAVDYVHADIRDETALRRVFDNVEPDIVFHVAAQRDPGAAERLVAESLNTNIFGTQNVLSASSATGVKTFVYASTGKALRPFTPHVYAASKKLGELLAYATAQECDLCVSVARFTHVADNSIVLDRFRSIHAGDALRVHDPRTQFYTQSAREAAQLLLVGNVTARMDETTDLLAIHDLGLPTGLLDLALAIASESPIVRPIYVVGDEPGYEDSFYPGLYDPETAANVSPLMSAFEAADAREVEDLGIDVSPIRVSDYRETVDMLTGLGEELREGAESARLRQTLDSISMSLFEATLDSAEPALLQRLVRLTAPSRGVMSRTDLVIDDGVRRRARVTLPPQ